jgi:hypothetical protein
MKNCLLKLLYFDNILAGTPEILIEGEEKVNWDPTEGRNLVWFGKYKENQPNNFI